MKENKISHFLNLLIIGLVSFGFRLLLYFKRNSLEFMNYDSYKYAKAYMDEKILLEFLTRHIGVVNTAMVLFSIFCISVYLFYIVLIKHFKLTKTMSTIISLFYSLSPLVIFNTDLLLLDKNHYSLSMIMIFACAYILTNKKSILNTVTVFLIALIFSFMWQGWAYILLLYLIHVLVITFKRHNFKYKNFSFKQKQVYLGIFVIGILCMYNFVLPLIKNSLFSFKFTGEMAPMFMVGFFAEYILVAFVWVMFVLFVRYNKNNNSLKEMFTDINIFIFLGFFIGFFTSQINFRNNIFLLPFIFLMIGYFFGEIEDGEIFKIWFLLILFIICTGISIDSIYLRESPFGDNEHELVKHIVENEYYGKDCLIGLWDKGYYYDYYFNDNIEIVYKASSGGMDEISKYITANKETQCLIVFNQQDLNAINFYLKNVYDDQLILFKNISEFNIGVKDNIGGYIIK